MPNPDDGTSGGQRLLALRLIVGAMLAGVVSLGVVVAVFVETGAVAGGLLLAIALVFFAGCLIASWILRRWWSDRLRREPRVEGGGSDRELTAPFFTLTVLRAGLMEAAGLLFVVVYVVEGSWLALLCAAWAALHLAALFPSRAAFARFVAEVEGRGFQPR